MIPVHIAGVGMTQFGKSSNTLVEIMRAAAVTVLSDGLLEARTRSDPRMLSQGAIQISPRAPF
jgi:hypothetical protein